MRAEEGCPPPAPGGLTRAPKRRNMEPRLPLYLRPLFLNFTAFMMPDPERSVNRGRYMPPPDSVLGRFGRRVSSPGLSGSITRRRPMRLDPGLHDAQTIGEIDLFLLRHGHGSVMMPPASPR